MNNWQAIVSAQVAAVEKELVRLKSFSNVRKKEINEDVISKIHYYNSLTDKIEDRRSKIQTFSYQYTAILLTISGVFISNLDKFSEHFKAVIFVVLGIQIISTLLIILVYNLQSSFSYPFLSFDKGKELTNQWKWFYYGNEYISKISAIPLSRIKRYDSAKHYFNGLHLMIKNFNDENSDDDLQSNLLQMFLLQVHNYYKNRFFLQLMNIRKWSFYLTLIFVIAYLILYSIDYL